MGRRQYKNQEQCTRRCCYCCLLSLSLPLLAVAITATAACCCRCRCYHCCLLSLSLMLMLMLLLKLLPLLMTPLFASSTQAGSMRLRRCKVRVGSRDKLGKGFADRPA